MRSVHFSASILAAKSSGGGAAIAQLFIFALIGLAMYLLLIRPQRRRQRAQSTLQKSIEIGDEVMTTSGMYGWVTAFDGDIAWLEVDDNVQVRVARQAIQRKVDTATGKTAVPTDDGTKSKQTKIDDIVVDSSDEA
ncbi:MAG: preprotein translocase subunit YajC [Actinomycetota bacterium]